MSVPQVARSTVGHGYQRSSEEPDTGFPAPMLTDPLRGPKGHLLTGNLPELRVDRLRSYVRWAREYGDLVPLRVGPRKIFLVSHPDLIRQVMVTDSHNFQKPLMLRINRLVFGNGLLTGEGELWRRQRRLVQPAFHHERIAGYAETMVSSAGELIEVWKDGEVRDIHEDMMRITLQIVGRTLFGADAERDSEDVDRAFRVVLERFVAHLRSVIPVPESLPTPRNLRLRRAVRRLDRIIYGYVAERRTNGEDRDDLLSMLLHARDDDGSGMSDQQLRDELMTVFLAGHETTAVALTWTWYLLSENPEVRRRLSAELDAVLGERRPVMADLQRLSYAMMVVTESMRLYPPAPTFGRDALRDCEVGGHRIPKGSTIVVSPWVVHRDPRFFEDPEAFRPERWSDGLARRLPKFAYFPFGGGPRLCIGSSFAMTEAVLLLATIAQRFRLDLVPGHPVKLWPTITLRPRFGMRMTVRQRHSARRHRG